MTELGLAFGIVAPWYNLALVAVAACLFVQVFKTAPPGKKVYVFPWKLLFFALIVFIIEEALTVLRQRAIIMIPVHINAFFELAIISAFIYTLLLQKEYVAKTFR